MAACDTHQIFARAVFAKLFVNYFWHFQHKMRGQFETIILCQIGHLIKRTNAFLIDPLPDLSGAHFGFFLRQPMVD